MLFLALHRNYITQAGQQGRSFFPARFTFELWANNLLSKSCISIDAKPTQAVGISWNIFFSEVKRFCIIHSTRDYEYLESFCSPCIAERSEVIVYVAELLLEIHKVKYSRLKVNPSYAYATSKYKPRINQMCKKSRYHRTSVIIDGL